MASNWTVLSQELKVTSVSFYLSHSLSVCRGKSPRCQLFCLPVKKKPNNLCIWISLKICIFVCLGTSLWKNLQVVYENISYVLSEDKFVNVMRKHWAGWYKTGVSRRHDSSGHSAQTHKRHRCWSEILKHHGKDHRLVKGDSRSLIGDIAFRWCIKRCLCPV